MGRKRTLRMQNWPHSMIKTLIYNFLCWYFRSSKSNIPSFLFQLIFKGICFCYFLSFLHGTQDISITPCQILCWSLSSWILANLLGDVSPVIFNVLIKSTHYWVSSINCCFDEFFCRCVFRNFKQITPSVLIL